MSSDFDRRLNDWFDAVEPRSAPPGILRVVSTEVRQTGQLRAPWHQLAARIEAIWTPRLRLSPSLAWVVVALLLITVLAAAAVASGLIRLPRVPRVLDGLIAVQDELDSTTHYVIRFIDPQTGVDVFTTPADARACGAHFSPDGSQYAFVNQDSNGDISVSVAPSGGEFERRQLVRKSSQAYFDPAWSPDGSALVMRMEVDVEGGYTTELWIQPADGTPGRRLTDLHATSEPDWSPSGDWIAFVGGPTDTQLYVIRPDGSDVRTLLVDGAYLAAWSPASEELAYSASDGKLHVISLDGEETFSADLNLAGGTPIWTHDATKIALVAEGSVQVFDVTTGSLTQIEAPSRVTRAVWSVGGRTLIVVTDAGQLWELSVDGTAPRLIAEHVTAACMSSGVALSWQQLTR